MRRHLQVGDAHFSFEHLIEFFLQLHAVVIPVLWGEKQQHENALHIYMPQSRTTWVLVNLDTPTYDFKFWMAHELGHAKAPDLRGEEAEKFADMFAGALLFPESEADKIYQALSKTSNVGAQVNTIKDTASHFEISPVTVWYQVETYFKANKLKAIKKPESLFAAATNLNKEKNLVSNTLLGENPTSKNYITRTETHFKSPFFEAVRAQFHDQQQIAAFLSQALNISGLDAQELSEELMCATV